ncbi:hypothetical protein PENNAL_c0009G03616 [Penicillium nalgiovense]|uniref:Uncharacterized protein n=1 Tax=Penicillium nalgiovense TaxID=60175 RepID=A0A1V6YW24_PENNA|nr:hypothetical protein PENNAL_c0009G03616 [Penicillium nalgiovense]
MSSIELQESTISNQTAQYAYISMDPAPALAIPPGKELINYSAKLERIFMYDASTNAEDCYTFAGSLSLEPGSVVYIVGGGQQIYLQYQVGGDRSVYMLQLQKVSGGHKLHRDVTSEALREDTILDRMLEEPVNDGFEPTMLAKAEKKPKVLGASSTLFRTAASGDLDHKLEKSDRTLEFIRSMMQIYTANRLEEEGKKRGKTISATEETALHMKVTADAYFDAAHHRALAPVLTRKSMAEVKYDRTCRREDVHPEFIQQFASELNFDKSEHAKLDKMLTELVRGILDGQLSVNDSVTYTFLAMQSLPENRPGRSEPVVVPTLKLFYIKSSGSTWNEVVKQGKSQSSVQKVHLQFQYIPMVCVVNVQNFKHMKKKYEPHVYSSEGIDDFFTAFTA